MTDSADKIIDVVTAKLDAIQNGLSELGKMYGPDVINAAINVSRIEALQGAAMWLIFMAIVVWIPFYPLKWLHKWKLSAKTYYSDGEGEQIVYGLSIVGYILILLVLFVMFDIWNFIGVVNPKLYIAHQIMEKIK